MVNVVTLATGARQRHKDVVHLLYSSRRRGCQRLNGKQAENVLCRQSASASADIDTKPNVKLSSVNVYSCHHSAIAVTSNTLVKRFRGRKQSIQLTQEIASKARTIKSRKMDDLCCRQGSGIRSSTNSTRSTPADIDCMSTPFCYRHSAGIF